MSSNGISKPKIVKVSKGSDRRAASGRKPASYLKKTTFNDKMFPLNHASTGQATGNGNHDGLTVKRSAGGKTWEDSSLLDWNPNHFRLFVGNLGEDANDQLLFEAFSRYPTMSKVKVPIDSKTNKNKGYGFVAFESSDDYFRAFQEMNGKYVGLHPIQLKRAESKIKVSKKKNKKKS